MTDEQRMELAAAAREDTMSIYVHDPSPRVLTALLGNPHIREEDVVIIAGRKNCPAGILETIARDKRWAESYPVRLALVRNPRSPLSVSLSIARYLRLYDLEEITRSHSLPVPLRHKVESIIIERIPTMPSGNKKTLAKKSRGNILLKLLQDADSEVVELCLDNPHLVEAHLYKVISREGTAAKTIQMIAEHPKWSSRSSVRFALTRNIFTPLSLSVGFLQSIKLTDLRELYADPSLCITLKPFVYRELLGRGHDPAEIGKEAIFEIDDEEMEAEALEDAAANNGEQKATDRGFQEQDNEKR